MQVMLFRIVSDHPHRRPRLSLYCHSAGKYIAVLSPSCWKALASVRDIINLTQNLACYGFYPGVSDEETLGRIYVDDLEMLDVPDQVKPYFDYEAYGRDACIHENGHFAPGGYVVKESDHFVEVYHGLQDIPKEHKVFSFPKLSIREQMAAYQEIIDGSSLEGYRQMQKKDRGDR